MWMLDCMSLHLAKSYKPILLCLESQIYLVPLCPLMLDVLYFSRAHLHVVNFSAGLKQTHSLIWYLYLRIKRTCRQPMEWQQLHDLGAASGLVSDWNLRSCSTQIGCWSDRTTIHFSSYYSSCADLLSSDASACGRLHWYLEEPAYGTLAHE